MYRVEFVDEAQEQVQALPQAMLSALAEVTVLLELAPFSGPAYNRDAGDAAMRTVTFGPDHEAFLVYLVLEDQLRVVVLDLIWTA